MNPKEPPKVEPKPKADNVDVTEDPTTGEELIEVSTVTEPAKGKEDDEITKAQRRMEYMNRKFEQGLRQINEIAERLSSTGSVRNKPEESGNDPKDDLDRIAEQDWKKAVDILAEKKARSILEEYEAKKQRETEQQVAVSELEKSKARVMKRYPQLEDENSDEARLYVQVLNENPNLTRNPYGPEIAMMRMEERMSSPGTPKKPDDIDREINRRVRVSSAFIPAGSSSGEKRHTVTKSEKEFCESRNIPLDQYVKMRELSPASLKEGVEVDE